MAHFARFQENNRRGSYLYTKDNGERGESMPKGASGGFRMKVSRLKLDYAITSMGELGYVHRATLGLAFLRLFELMNYEIF